MIERILVPHSNPKLAIRGDVLGKKMPSFYLHQAVGSQFATMAHPESKPANKAQKGVGLFCDGMGKL